MHCEIVSYVLKGIICWVHPRTVDYCTERTIKETRDWKDEWEKRHQRGQLWWVSTLYSLVLCGVVWSVVPHSVINFWSLRPMQHWMPLMVWLSFWIIYHYTVESTSAVTTYNMDTLLPSLWLMSTMIFPFSRTLCNKLIA